MSDSFFQVEDAPVLVGVDIDGNALYTGDEVYVVGGRYLRTDKAHKHAKFMADYFKIEVKVL